MAATTYLVRLTKEELLAVSSRLASDPEEGFVRTLGRKIRGYLNFFPQGHCADCGERIQGNGYVSPESAELTEVVLEGYKAIEAGQRVVCTDCYRAAYHRVSGPDSTCPI